MWQGVEEWDEMTAKARSNARSSLVKVRAEFNLFRHWILRGWQLNPEAREAVITLGNALNKCERVFGE